MILKFGSKGDAVKELQRLLGINADGDFGVKTEQAVKEYQKANGLVVDGVVGDKTFAVLTQGKTGLDIVQAPIDKNLVAKTRSNASIKYLVIHYTAGRSSAKGAALANRAVFLTRQASADFIVDDAQIVQVNPDPHKYYTYAVGDGKGKYGITNANSISIEICSTLMPGTSAAVPNHEGWGFTEAAMSNAVKLAKHLMAKYDISIENVVRHYDASRKNCPGIIGWNGGAIYTTDGARTTRKNDSSKWMEFKKRLL